ncbi:MAG: GAF domain-containing protein [Bulleidia sp.]
MSIQNEQIKALLEEPDMIAALSNVTAAVKMNYSECNWVGFYRIGDNELVLGPFQGLPACTHIAFTDGVCGKTYRTKQTQRVGDVRQFPGHIACDQASRSELCVPVIIDQKVVLILDLDAPVPDYFSLSMAQELTETAVLLAEAWEKHGWRF